MYEALVLKAREMHLGGATVLRGALGYGISSRLHTAKILRLSEDLPVREQGVLAEPAQLPTTHTPHSGSAFRYSRNAAPRSSRRKASSTVACRKPKRSPAS